jgi:hypothetical protein
MNRREKTLARRLEINPVDDITMRDLERGTLRHRLGTALVSLIRRPSGTRANPVPEVRTATNN